MVHCDHASILHRYGDIKPQMLDGRTQARTDARLDGRSGNFIFCPTLCIALRWTDKNLTQSPDISYPP